MYRTLTTLPGKLVPKNTGEWFAVIFALSTFIGTWYALPMLDAIKDTAGFSGGVLRSIDAHTLLPGVLAYGTVTFYVCYVVIAAVLALAFPFFHFSIDALKGAVLNHPGYIYELSRAVSAAFVAGFLLYVYRFLQEEVADEWYRIAIISAVFGNILVAAISRTGKVWVISSVLGTLAVLFAYRAWVGSVQRPYAWRSFLCAALAAANFPLAGLYGIVVPLLLYRFRKDRGMLVSLLKYAVAAGAITAAIIALNYKNIYGQVLDIFAGYHPIFTASRPANNLPQLSFIPSLGLHLEQVVAAFPIILILCVFALLRGIRNKTLFWIGTGVMLLYIFAISFVANWYVDLNTYLRYLYPLGFLFILVLAGLRAPRRAVSVVLTTVNVVLYVYAILMLSLPATYNLAAAVVVDRWSAEPIVIDNNVFELDLPMNKASYALLHASNCATKCESALAQPGDISFRPIVVTPYSDASTSTAPVVSITDTRVASCGTPFLSIPAIASTVVDPEYGLGNYFNAGFYSGIPFGLHIYFYSGTCYAPPSTLDADTQTTIQP